MQRLQLKQTMLAVGLVSMTGTFLDTIVVCTITVLTVVMSGLYVGATSEQASSMTGAAFTVLLPGNWGGTFVTIALIFFAFSTILGWSYYGEKCLYYLGGAWMFNLSNYFYPVYFCWMYDEIGIGLGYFRYL